uniref:Uncharacterized protein n=1 Tax=Panagrolaimus sp. JU765 TaxID=591449 RepID=A0AC34R9K7_9BILA
MMKGCLLLLFVFLAKGFADEISVKKSENYELTVPGASFKVEVCRTDAINRLLFCYEAASNEDGNIGCGTGFCGAKLFFAESEVQVGLTNKISKTTKNCEMFEINEQRIAAKNSAQINNCHWKRTSDGSLTLKVIDFPSGWTMTIKDVINKKPNQNAAIPWWAYLLGVVGLGLVGGSIALIVWLVKRKSQKKNKNPEELELKEVKVIADQPRQTQKVENITKPKEEQPTKEPKAVPEKKEKVKPNKPKLVLERSKDEEAPESLETFSVPS